MLLILILMLIFISIISIITIFSYHHDMGVANNKLQSYHVKTFDTQFGNMSYVDEGTGETILISHGIFGGYDQGFISLKKLVGTDYRKLSPSRFGYPGSSLPENPTPKNQAKVFKDLLDKLEIEKSFILSTSAGGASGLQFALEYPERTKGLILLSSGAPDKQRTVEELKELGMTGPPEFLINDFPMWFTLKFFSFAINSMFGANNTDENLIETMLPVGLRRQGVISDTKITNIDMTLNYNEYPLEAIEVPILVIHAKDDPMAKYENIEKLLKRVEATTAIYETGGHMLEGHDCSADIKNFIKNTQ